MNLKSIAAVATLMSSGAAFAGVTANVGVTSEYMYRGIPQTNGPAVQGGIDWAGDSGLYLGVWASNVNFAGAEGGNELDLYGGFGFKAGPVALDFGGIGYFYSELGENGGDANGDIDFFEAYAGATVGPVAAKVYFSPDYNNNSQQSIYGTATATFPVTDKLSLFAQAGSENWNDTDSYIDYSAGATASTDGGVSVTLAAFNTEGRGPATAPAFATNPPDDEVKFVISAKKVFSL